MTMRFAFCLLCAVCGIAHAGGISRRIVVGEHERSYTLYVPASISERTPAAIVIAFHGGTGSGRNMAELSRFSAVADREGFLVAYPDGLHGHWRDGRTLPRGMLAEGADDVAFVAALLDDASKFHKLDPHRIFAAGISNGGIFSHYLALKMSDRIAAIGVVSGGIATEIAADFKPAQPVSVLIIHGTSDPLVPYNGGNVARAHGSVVSTGAAVELWRSADGLQGEPKRQHQPATAGACGEEWQSWSGGRKDSALTVIALDGGGHAWPGAAKNLPAAVVGTSCPELDATRTIWEFFKQHPKP
jgi:polyhydroxybutyrate depolymerase